MKIKMIVDADAYPDGKTKKQYLKGKTYDVSKSIGGFFIAVKKAVVVKISKGVKKK